MNTKSITIAALITLSSLSMSQTAMADEITENTATTAISQTSNNDFSTTALIDSVQNTVEQQVDAQLDRFVSAVGSSIETNLDTILSVMVSK